MKRFAHLLSLLLCFPAGAQVVIAQSESSAGSRIVYIRAVSTTTGIPAAPGSLSSGDLKVSKAGGAEANTAGTFTSLGNGECTYQATQGECDTVGTLTVRLLKTGYTGLGIATVTDGLLADMRKINGGATNGYNATLKLQMLDVQNNAGTAISAVSTYSGNAHGLYCLGTAAGAGIKAVGGNGTANVAATAAPGIDGIGGYSWTGGSDPTDGLEYGGPGIRGTSRFAPGITAKSFGYPGLSCFSEGGNSVGAQILGNGTGESITFVGGSTASRVIKIDQPANASAHGIEFVGGASGSAIRLGRGAKFLDNNNSAPSSLGTVTMDVTGSLSGSVGGNVGGNVNGNVNGFVFGDEAVVLRGTTGGDATLNSTIDLGDATPFGNPTGCTFSVPGLGIVATIVSYDSATNIATVAQDTGGPVGAGTTYALLGGPSLLAGTTHSGATIPTVTTLTNGVTINGTSVPTTILAPLNAKGDLMTVVKGDDYSATDGRSFEWTASWWPDLTGATITFTATLDADTFSTSGSVVTATGSVKKIRVQLTSAQTGARSVNQYKFDVQATLSNGHKVTLAKGRMDVLDQVTP